MAAYRVSGRADAELLDFCLFGVTQFGRPRAIEYQMSFQRCFELIAENPRMGRHSPTIRPGLRRHEHGSHVVLYRQEADPRTDRSDRSRTQRSKFEAVGPKSLLTLTNRTLHALFAPIFRAP